MNVFAEVTSITSINISWVESANVLSQHSPNDTYTVAVIPDCKYYQPAELVTPPPQTVSYFYSSVEITNLGMILYAVNTIQHSV